MRHEEHNLHGTGHREHEVYDMPPPPQGGDYWTAVTQVPCPVQGCDQTVVWYESGYVPGYRVCMRAINGESYDPDTIRHRFLADRSERETPTLIRDDCCE